MRLSHDLCASVARQTHDVRENVVRRSMVINARNFIWRTSCECLANVARRSRECRETFANESCDNRTTFVRLSQICRCDRNVIMVAMSYICRQNVSQISLEIVVNCSHPSEILALAVEIAETRPYMNIKVAAFTVSEKSINIAHSQIPSPPQDR